MRLAHLGYACVPFVATMGACSFVSDGLGGDVTFEVDSGAPRDTAVATLDADPEASLDATPDTLLVDAFDAFDATDAFDAVDAVDAMDTRDAGDVRDTAEAGPPPLCSGDPDIVACFRFENDGFARQPHDESLYANHGSTFTAAFFVPGVHGSALSVNAGSAVRVPDSATLDVTALTLEMRFRPWVVPTTGRAGLLDDNGQFGLFVLAGGKVQCTVATAPAAAIDSPAVVAVVGRWTHVACVSNGTALIMYVDGAPVNFAAAPGSISAAGVDGVAIGMNSPSGDNLTGELDDLRIWRRALTTPEVCASATGAPCPP